MILITTQVHFSESKIFSVTSVAQFLKHEPVLFSESKTQCDLFSLRKGS